MRSVAESRAALASIVAAVGTFMRRNLFTAVSAFILAGAVVIAQANTPSAPAPQGRSADPF